MPDGENLKVKIISNEFRTALVSLPDDQKELFGEILEFAEYHYQNCLIDELENLQEFIDEISVCIS